MSSGRAAAAMAAGRRGGLLGALLTAALSSVGAYLALELWRARLTVPFRYAQMDDTKFYFGMVKSIIDHGWYQHNPNLGAPFGQALYDFPQGADNLNFLLIKLLGVFSSNYALVTNLFFLLTFPLTALAAYYALRRLYVGPSVAVVCSVLFALLPYHFYRHESQVLLSAYYAVPLGAYLFLSLFEPRPLFARRAGAPPALAWASRRTAATIVICVVIGSAGLYYAVFAILLLLVGVVIAAVAGRGRRVILGAAVLATAIALTVTINLAPSLLYSLRHGSNTRIARTPLESEQLGLRLSNLVLPVRGHRLPPLADVNARYAAETSPGYCESCNETLGVVGAVGFVVLWLVALAACAAAVAAGGREPPGREWQLRLRPAALGAAIAFAIGTTGGISALIAFLLTPNVRGWNRISLYIAFFSLLAVAVLLGRAGRRLRGESAAGRRGPAAAAALLVAVLVLGFLDETSTYFVVDYAAASREYGSDVAFGRVIQSRLSAGASVLELPYVPFPEGYHIPGLPPPSAFSTSYDLLRPYLNTNGLHWSFGSIKGRPTDWEQALAAKRLDVVVAAAAASGFQAIYVDPRGYDPAHAHQLVGALTQLTATAPLISPRRDALLFDLRPYAASLRARTAPAALAAVRAATLDPLLTGCGAFPNQVILTNPGATPRTATLSASLSAPLPGAPVTLLISFPDGAQAVRVVGPAGATLLHRLVVAPGHSKVRFTIVGIPPFGTAAANPAFVVSAPTLTDDVFAPLRLRPAAASAALPVAGQVGPTCSDLYAASAASKLPSPSNRRSAAPRRAPPAF